MDRLLSVLKEQHEKLTEIEDMRLKGELSRLMLDAAQQKVDTHQQELADSRQHLNQYEVALKLHF